MNSSFKSYFYTLISFCVLSTSIIEATTYKQLPFSSLDIIVHTAPKGESDALVRILAKCVATPLKNLGIRSVNIKNIPGNAGLTAMKTLAESPNDGSVLGTLPIELALLQLSNPSQLPLERFSLISLTDYVKPFIWAREDADAQRLFKASSDKPLLLGHSGNGGVWQLAWHMFLKHAGQNVAAGVKEVAFDGSGPALQALADGKVDFVVSGAGASGLLKSFSSVKIKTIAPIEGLLAWGGIGAPAGVPKDIVSAYNSIFSTCLKSQETRDAFAEINLIAASSTPKEFKDFIDAQISILKNL